MSRGNERLRQNQRNPAGRSTRTGAMLSGEITFKVMHYNNALLSKKTVTNYVTFY